MEERNSFDRVDALAQKNIFSLKGAKKLKDTLDLICALRFKAQLFYKEEKDYICHPAKSEPQDNSLFYFTKEDLLNLPSIYAVLLQFHDCVSKFLTTENMGPLKSDFSDLDPRFNYMFMKHLNTDEENALIAQQVVALDPNDASALIKLAEAEINVDQYERAFERLQTALKLAQQEHGETHYTIADCYFYIGRALNGLRRYKEAIVYCQKALTMNRRLRDEKHHRIADCLRDMGQVLANLGDFEQAEKYYREGIELAIQKDGANHYSVGDGYAGLGYLFLQKKEPQQAIEYFQKAFSIGTSHRENRAVILSNIGAACEMLGNITEALKWYLKSLEQAQGHKNVEKLIPRYEEIGKVYSKIKDYDKAIENFNKCLEIIEKVHGKQSLIQVKFHFFIADCLNQLKKYTEALEQTQIVQKILNNNKNIKNYTPYLRELARIDGEALEGLEQYQYALQLYQMALEYYHPDTTPLIILYEKIGSLFSKTAQLEKSLEFFTKSFLLRCKLHPEKSSIRNCLAQCLQMAEAIPTAQAAEKMKEIYPSCLELLSQEDELTQKVHNFLRSELT